MASGAKILDIKQLKARKQNRCIFCNSSTNLQKFRNQIVCLDCLMSVRSLYRNGYFEEEMCQKQ